MKGVIADYRLTKSSTMTAFLDVLLDSGMLIRDCRVIEMADGRTYLKMPNFEWKNSAGDIQRKAVIQMPIADHAELSKIIIAQWQQIQNKEPALSDNNAGQNTGK